MRRLGLIALAGLVALSLPAQAQSGDAGQTIAQWNASNATCRNANAPALEAMGACEQRDRFSKLLALANHCYGPTESGGPPGWSPCDAAKAARDSALARTLWQFVFRLRIGLLAALLGVSGGNLKPIFFRRRVHNNTVSSSPHIWQLSQFH